MIRKQKSRIMLITLILLGVFILSACEKQADDSRRAAVNDQISRDDLIGVWKGMGNEPSTMTFNSDGSYKDDAGDIVIAGTFTVDEAAGTVTIHEEEYGMVFTYNCELSDGNLTLQIEGGLPRTFSKKY